MVSAERGRGDCRLFVVTLSLTTVHHLHQAGNCEFEVVYWDSFINDNHVATRPERVELHVWTGYGAATIDHAQ